MEPTPILSTFGMKAKKLHEVERCVTLARDVLGGQQQAHILDVGAGRVRPSIALPRAWL
jgi:hypothetical protein